MCMSTNQHLNGNSKFVIYRNDSSTLQYLDNNNKIGSERRENQSFSHPIRMSLY